uniref:Fiber protein Fb34 n=1 Tax=Cucumis melo TaxID=3656 RepID=A0A9I9D361_CUCME
MAVSAIVLATIASLHLIAFVLAVGAERRRSTANVVPDEYDEKTYCVYGTDASTVYGLSAFGLLLISQAVVNGVTRCFCCGKGLISGKTTTVAIFFFVFSWYVDPLSLKFVNLKHTGFENDTKPFNPIKQIHITLFL